MIKLHYCWSYQLFQRLKWGIVCLITNIRIRGIGISDFLVFIFLYSKFVVFVKTWKLENRCFSNFCCISGAIWATYIIKIWHQKKRKDTWLMFTTFKTEFWNKWCIILRVVTSPWLKKQNFCLNSSEVSHYKNSGFKALSLRKNSQNSGMIFENFCPHLSKHINKP